MFVILVFDGHIECSGEHCRSTGIREMGWAATKDGPRVPLHQEGRHLILANIRYHQIVPTNPI